MPASEFNLHFHGDHNKPAVLFLHGFMGNSNDWQPVIEILSQNYCCLTVDLPGHGKHRIDAPVSMKACAGILVRELEKADVRQCHLLGYSMGGRLALYMTVHYPQRWDRIIIESATPGLQSRAEREKRRKLDQSIIQKIQNESFENFLKNWYTQPLFASIKKNAKFKYLLERRLQNDPTQLALSMQGMGAGAQENLWPQLPEISRPVLLIHGALDEKYQHILAQMAEYLPTARVHTISECGHNVHFEKTQEFAQIVNLFLGNKRRQPNGSG